LPDVAIDFFRVTVVEPNYAGTFETVLNTINALQGEARNVPTKSGWQHFHRMAVQPHSIVGDILNVRADQLPAAADREGRIEDLALEMDQGIAAVTYFYYRRANRVLLMLRSPGGLSAPGLEHLVHELSGIEVEILPVPQPELIRRLKKMREISRLEMKIATPDAAAHFKGGAAIAGMFDLMSEFDARVIEVKLFAGRRKNIKLNRTKALSVAEQLYRVSKKSGDVKKAKVRGLDPVEQRTVVLDLLHGRMVVSATVEVGQNRRLVDTSCLGALENAYLSNRDDIIDSYPEE